MTRRIKARNLLTALFAGFVAVVFAGADFAALAQNDNGSSTQNANTGTTNAGRRRRGRRGARRRGNMNANMGEMNANTGDNTNAAENHRTGGRPARVVSRTADAAVGEINPFTGFAVAP